MMNQIRAAVDKVLEWAVIFLMGANVLNVLWQVFTRFVLRNPSSYTEELARFLLIWVGLLGASYAVSKKLHLAIDYFTGKIKGTGQVYVEMFIQFCVFSFALFVMVVGGLRLVIITLTLNQISAALQIQLGYVYMVLPISGLLIMFYSLLFMIDQFRILSNRNASVENPN